MTSRRVAAVAVAAALLAGAAGCAHARSSAAPPPRQPAQVTATPSPSAAASRTVVRPRFPAYAATARHAQVAVFDRPGGRVSHRLANPGLLGAPLTFLVVRSEPRWLLVRLPVRPNGATGWVRAADVTVSGLRYRLDLHRGAHRLDLYDGERRVRVRSFPVAIGRADTPTPGGTYFLDALVGTGDPGGPYGPFAFGLNAFPPGIEVFNGQQAVIGLHGTNHPELIGQDVSHGCIRMRNADITALVHLLPLGTPVRILP